MEVFETFALTNNSTILANAERGEYMISTTKRLSALILILITLALLPNSSVNQSLVLQGLLAPELKR